MAFSITSPAYSTLADDSQFPSHLLSDLSSFLSARFSLPFNLLAHSACGSISAYSPSGRRLLAFHLMQNSFTATVVLYVLNTDSAATEATALASALSAFGMTGQLSLAVIPAGQTIAVTVPCSATTSVALGSNCSSLTSSPVGGAALSFSSSNSLSTGAIVGIVVGGVVGSVVLICVLVALLRRRKHSNDSASGQQSPSTPSPPAAVVNDRYFLHQSPTPPTGVAASVTPTVPHEASRHHASLYADEPPSTPKTSRMLLQPHTPMTPITPITPMTPMTPITPQRAVVPQQISFSVGVQADELEVDECAARLEAEATSHYDVELRRAEVHLGGI